MSLFAKSLIYKGILEETPMKEDPLGCQIPRPIGDEYGADGRDQSVRYDHAEDPA